MINRSIIIILAAACIILTIIAAYFYIKNKKNERDIVYIRDKLLHISESSSDEKVMLFTENKEIVKLLEEINCLLESMQKMKADYRRIEMSSKRMLSNISHDIKTPLTVILGYIEILSFNEKNEENRVMLNKISDKGRQLMELITKFFSLAKIEAGDTDLELSKLDICEICRKNIVDFYDVLTAKKFEVEVMIPEEPVYIFGNEEALQRILFNLISNAVKYGDEGRYLKMELNQDDENVYIHIVDKGKGIDKESTSKVFDRLYTLDDSRNKNIQGNGLGLAIVKALVEKINGDITLTSIPHVKTDFTVTLRKTFVRIGK